ncbi:MAG TPA: hypothetical protein VK157_09945 [Phycisphaerales bacterium]|nr:hypothetical protein [Phycisphaerales bacterium]
MNLSHRSVWAKIPWQVFAGLAFALPVFGVVVTREFVLHGGPRIALASQDDILPLMTGDESSHEEAVAQKAATRDAALVRSYDERAKMKVTRSPVVGSLRGVRQSHINAAMDTPMPMEPTQPSVTSGMPAGLSVTSILAAPTGNRAVVGGKLRSVGDRIASGWYITAIDADAGIVSCENDAGEIAELRIKRPGRPKDAIQEP